MLRAFILSIVLTLAIGPDAAILCEALCAGKADVVQPCDHDGPDLPQIAAGGDCCDHMAAGAAPSQFPAMRRGTSLPDGNIAMPVLRDTLVRGQTAESLGYEPGRRPSLVHQPLLTILRI
ncbi:MAG: hypothetical protein RJA55_2356 [Acidobacteriota bacterium]